MRWGTNHVASIDKLRQVQGSLTVGLIMVPRASFETCCPAESAVEVKRRNPDNFGFFPVEDGDRILGLYHAERWFDMDAPDVPVGEDYQALSEDILIAADASIFDFIMQADKHPTNLVVSGSRIAGLVSLSDIQQLPVRAALFSAITSFEMTMAMVIETQWSDPNDWVSKLPQKRQDRLRAEMKKSRAGDAALTEIAYTQFCDKKTLVTIAGITGVTKAQLEKGIGRIERLRDKLAHANEFAGSSDDAKKVCDTVRRLYELKGALLKFIEDSQLQSAQ